MQRYFIDKALFYESYAHIVEDYHHIKNVMRTKIGANIIISIDDNTAFLTEITSFEDSFVLVKVINKIDSREINFELRVAVGLMSNQKMELIIQKLTEIGVSEIIPLSMTRSIVKDKSSKLERFSKIAKEAAEQSHRSIIPKISPVIKLKDLELSEENFYAYELSEGEKFPIYEIKKSNSILVIIGPEGGIDLKEVELLKSRKFKEVSLGNRILRAETACIVAASNIVFIKENLI